MKSAEELGITEELRMGQQAEKEKEEEAREDFYAQGTQGQAAFQKENWSLSQAKEYVSYAWKHAWMIAGGVSCFICALFLSSFADDLSDFGWMGSVIADALSSFFFFLGVVAGVFLLIFASGLKKNYPVISKGMLLSVDEETAEYMRDRRKKDEDRCFKIRLAGIICCILSVAPSSIFIFTIHSFLSDIIDNSFLFIVAAGVFLIVAANSVMERYKEFGRAASVASREEEVQGNLNAKRGENVFSGQKSKKGRGLAAVLIILCVFVLLACICIPFLVWRYSYSTVKGYKAKTQSFSYKYDADKVNEIQVDLDMENLIVTSGAVDKITLDYSGTGNLTEKLKNGTLSVRSGSNSSWHFFGISLPFVANILNGNLSAGEVTLTFPESKMQTENYNFTNLENIDVSRPTDGTPGFSITMDTGNLEMSEIIGKDILLEVDVGNVVDRKSVV